MKRNVVHSAPEKQPGRVDVPSNTKRVRYQKLVNSATTTTTDNGFSAMQYAEPPVRVPWKALCLASVLFIFGGMLLTLGTLLMTGVIDAKYSDRTWPLLLLGFLMFIPGAYHVRIAVYAWKGEYGYSFDDIPDFD